MAGNEVLVKFDGDNSGLKKSAKGAEDAIDGVKGASDEADQSIQKTGDSGTTAGEKIGKGFKIAGVAAAAAAAAATAVVVKLVSESIKAYADFEQLSGGVDKLFGAASETVMANAKNAYKTAGLSANQYMDTVTSFSASLISGLGGDTQKAAELANMAIGDMSDNANTYGTDMQAVQNAYQGFAKGQFAMLDNLKLGYGGSASEMARLINDSGVMGDTMVTAATVTDVSMDKMIEAIHGVQTEMKITGTTANEAASTISGSLASTKAAWTNVLASFGSGDDNQIEEALNGFVESAGNFVTNISKILPNIISGIVTLLDKLIPEIPGLFELLLPPLIDGVISVLDGLVKAIPGLIKVLVKIIPSLVDGFVKVFVSIVDALPEILDGLLTLFNALAVALLDPKMIKTVIQSLVKAVLGMVDAIVKFMEDPKALTAILQGAITLFLEIVKALPKIIIALVGAIPSLVSSIVSFLTDPKNMMLILQAMLILGLGIIGAIVILIPQIIGELAKLLPKIGEVFGKIPALISNVWDKVVEWVKGVPAKIVGAFGGIGASIKGVFDGAIDGVKNAFKTGLNWIIGKINSLIKGVNKVSGMIPGIGDSFKIGELDKFAQGGHVRGRGTGTSDSIPAMVSNGEYVVKADAVRNIGLANMELINQGELPRRGDSPIVGEMNVYKDTDPLVLAQQIGSMVRFA
jgi:phage-related protein